MIMVMTGHPFLRVGRHRKRGDDVSWADANLTGQKMKKMHTINLVATNGQ
jgi:hypothetical protein